MARTGGCGPCSSGLPETVTQAQMKHQDLQLKASLKYCRGLTNSQHSYIGYTYTYIALISDTSNRPKHGIGNYWACVFIALECS